jgi:threonine synthase
MKYYSLNHNAPKVSFQEAVIQGLAPDQGLYFPEHLTPISASFFDKIETLSNEEIAFQVIHEFVGDEIPEINLRQIITETLCFDFPLVKVENNIYSWNFLAIPLLVMKEQQN